MILQLYYAKLTKQIKCMLANVHCLYMMFYYWMIQYFVIICILSLYRKNVNEKKLPKFNDSHNEPVGITDIINLTRIINFLLNGLLQPSSISHRKQEYILGFSWERVIRFSMCYYYYYYYYYYFCTCVFVGVCMTWLYHLHCPFFLENFRHLQTDL